MTEEDRRVRAAFRRSLAGSAPRPDDPSLDTIWKAARGELSREETRSVLEQVISSPACTEAWLIARRFLEAERDGAWGTEMSVISEEAPGTGRSSPGDPGRRTHAGGRDRLRIWKPAVAAAAVVIVFLAGYLWTNRTRAPIYRGEPGRMESLLPDGAELSRNEAVLLWRPGPEGTRYQVRIFREDFSPLIIEEDLTEPRFEIPESRLEGVADGETLHWQVASTLPDGERILSEPLVIRIKSREGAGGSESPRR